jgi:hypothetical protein
MSSPYPSIYDPNPAQEDALILRLQYDLAMGMHDAETIAHRYGLDGKDALKEYLRLHPVIVYEARKLRALYLSDEATEVRIRNKFMHATEQLIIPMTALINDPRTPIAQRIDGFKQFQRGAGVDGAPAGAKDAQQKSLGAAFNLTINFAGGRKDYRATTVVEADEIPPPRQSISLRPDEDDAEFEDVEV